ncbi:MAG: hypothetical protein AAF909_07580 [Pseudomonadota bacterium]
MTPDDTAPDPGPEQPAEPLGWDGGQEQSAARAELERLKKLGEGLRDLAAEAGRVADPDKLAEIQDRNLAAFEHMTAEMGLAALDRMRAALALLSAPPESGPEGPAKAGGETPIVAAAQSEIEAWRDRETTALLRAMRAHFQGPDTSGGKTEADDGAFEPFEAPDADTKDG